MGEDIRQQNDTHFATALFPHHRLTHTPPPLTPSLPSSTRTAKERGPVFLTLRRLSLPPLLH